MSGEVGADVEALARILRPGLFMRPDGESGGKATQMARDSARQQARAVLASAWFADRVDEARLVERDLIVQAIERRRLKRRARWLRRNRWSGRDEACWSQGMWDAARIARTASPSP